MKKRKHINGALERLSGLTSSSLALKKNIISIHQISKR
jgi:hypothetical protein